jgi:hypothetical protein
MLAIDRNVFFQSQDCLGIVGRWTKRSFPDDFAILYGPSLDIPSLSRDVPGTSRGGLVLLGSPKLIKVVTCRVPWVNTSLSSIKLGPVLKRFFVLKNCDLLRIFDFFMTKNRGIRKLFSWNS